MDIQALQGPKRATGRSTRMFNEAVRLSRDGSAVYIISRNKHLQRLVDEMESRGAIKCEEHIPKEFDWLQMRVRGSHPNCVWLIDHHSIESDPVFAAMFSAMTRFDEAATK